MNKFNKGDIVYSVYVDEHLIVNINKLVVDSFFFNHLPQYNEFIYSCTGLSQIIIRDYETPEAEGEKNNSRNPGATISSSSRDTSLYLQSELETVIQQKVQDRVESNRRVIEEAEKFRCPITGEKMSYIEEPIFYRFDGPAEYKVEGSKIIWEKWPRGGGIYQTTHDGKEYKFIYHGDGNWENKNLN